MNLQIRNLTSLLNVESNIREYKIENLMKPGENYGSLMLKVSVVLENGEKFEMVAKTPPANAQMQKLFNIPTTFRNEIYFYKKIFPLLREFQKEQGSEELIDFYPKYYGSRCNLSGTDVIDADAVLLLENLKVVNFVNLSRTHGVDLKLAKIILSDLAQLNGIPLALKLQKPDVFASQIRPYLETLKLPQNFNEDMKAKNWTLITQLPGIEPFLEKLEKVSFETMYVQLPPREPFATICHNDCWVNNTMQLFENGNVVKNKLVDFQICEYGSPARDVLFFLFTSVQIPVLEEFCDELIDHYYSEFIKVLKQLKVDNINDFSREIFDQELKTEATLSQLAHILLMFFPIFTPHDSVAKDFADIEPENFGRAKATPLHEERLSFVVQEFAKRSWI